MNCKMRKLIVVALLCFFVPKGRLVLNFISRLDSLPLHDLLLNSPAIGWSIGETVTVLNGKDYRKHGQEYYSAGDIGHISSVSEDPKGDNRIKVRWLRTGLDTDVNVKTAPELYRLDSRVARVDDSSRFGFVVREPLTSSTTTTTAMTTSPAASTSSAWDEYDHGCDKRAKTRDATSVPGQKTRKTDGASSWSQCSEIHERSESFSTTFRVSFAENLKHDIKRLGNVQGLPLRAGNLLHMLRPLIYYAASHGCILLVDSFRLHRDLPLEDACLVPTTWTQETCNISEPSFTIRELDYTRRKLGPFKPGSAEEAMRLIMNFNSTHVFGTACPSTSANRLAVKIRSGDIMCGHWEGNTWKSCQTHHAYRQPPLAFYVALLRIRNWTSVTVLCEDFMNPVCVILQNIAQLKSLHMNVLGMLPIRETIEIMACATAVANAQGTMRLLWYHSGITNEEFFWKQEQKQRRLTPPGDGCTNAEHAQYFLRSRYAPSDQSWSNSGLQRFQMLCPDDVEMESCLPETFEPGCGPFGCR